MSARIRTRPRPGQRRPGLRRLAPTVTAGTAAVLLLASAGQAQAGAYRYWSFWERDGHTWTYATEGPAMARPSDGDLEGFRFSVSQDSADSAQPRGAADFSSICASTAAKDGQKRVAFVLDFGTAKDAPSGETPPEPRTACAQVSEDATTAEALAAVAKPLRYDSNALLCAIAGYPRTGCGESVSDSGSDSGSGSGANSNSGSDSGTSSASSPRSASSAAKSSDGGPSVGLIAGAAAVVVLGAAAVWQARRRRG